MALYRRPASPVEGKSGAAKKVAMASVGKYESSAVETKIAVAEPKVDRPIVVNRVVSKPAVPVAEAATDVKEKKVARPKVDAKKPAEKPAVKSVAAQTVEAAKKEAVKKEAPKAPAKKEAAKAPAKKETAKAPAKKEAAKAPAKKETAAKTPAKKASYEFYVEFNGQQVSADVIEAKVAEQCRNSGINAKSVTIYVKPEENKIYPVADGKGIDAIDLF